MLKFEGYQNKLIKEILNSPKVCSIHEKHSDKYISLFEDHPNSLLKFEGLNRLLYILNSVNLNSTDIGRRILYF